jgi:DNA polymerase I
MLDSLWGEEFTIVDKPKTKKIIDKIKKEKTEASEKSTEKIIKSKNLSFSDKLPIIKEKVYNILGKQIDNISVIYSKEQLHNYLQKGLKFGRISIDTETNNSLDPITCKLMGLCLYVKDEKQVYIPVNHINPETNEKLSNQLTEKDINDELSWLMKNKCNCKFVFHNGKFDYQVLKRTCGVELDIDWDTMIGAKLLDENEKSAGLKQQYIDKIDKNQEKYSIDNLFEGLEYSLFEPELFSLYAATDAMITDKLYEYQMDRFKDPDLSRVLKLANEVEMPLIKVVAEMEDYGVEFDNDYNKILAKKYHDKLNNIDKELEEELLKIKPRIDAWRLTPEANDKQKSLKSDKLGKSKSEQLEENINLGSPTQLAILFYDVLKCPSVSKKSPRGTGEEELKALSKKMKMKLFDNLIERRAVVKLLDSFIDSLPEAVNIDGRIHCKFNQYGAATGRFSSSDPNLQQIPSHNSEIRMIFKASSKLNYIEEDNSCFKVSSTSDIFTQSGWKKVSEVKVGELISVDDSFIPIVRKEKNVETYIIYI